VSAGALVVRGFAVAIVCGVFAGNIYAKDVDESTGLIIDDNWQLVRIHCGGCHSHALVTGQRADRNTWEAIIRWMQATQNLWQFDEATENGILDYLASNYPPNANRRRAPIPPNLMPVSGSER